MRSTLRPGSLALVLGLLLAPLPAGAQQVAGLEGGFQGMVLLQDPVWGGGAITGAWRPPGAIRFSLALGAGAARGRWTGRGELLAHFLLNPARQRGLGFYGFGGVAGMTGSRAEGYLVLGLGLERGPGGASGWFVETGVGGGARLSAGWRWRRLGRAGRP